MTQGPDKTRLRIAFLGMVFIALLAALVLRLWFLQVLAHASYQEAASNNQVRIVPLEATRGRILDRNGEVLVSNRKSLSVSIRPDELKDRKETIDRLAALLGITSEQIEERLRNKRVLPYTPIPVAEDVPEDKVIYIREHQDQFQGVIDEMRPVRVYPRGTLGAHLLGYVGEITAEQIENKTFSSKEYHPGTLVGKAGLERAYEKDLHGKKGDVKIIVDASGKVQGDPDRFERREPEPGADLVSTIDVRIQSLVEDSLAQGLAKARTVYDKERAKFYLAQGGGAVVLDPRNGEVIAMASFPTFDPGLFVGGIGRAEFKALSDDPANPLINRPAQAAYPPGSTFKIVTAAAALEDGVAQRNGKYPCPPSYRFRDRTFRNWKTTDSGSITLAQALVESCDTVFYSFGAEFYGRFTRKEGERLQDHARAFGFGAKSGFELDEKPGRVPDAKWLKDINKRYPKSFPNSVWLPGYTINMSIGQGDLLTTPLQLANAFAAVANGGTIYRPHLALEADKDGGPVRKVVAEPIRKIQISPANLEVIRRGLVGVATNGTARGAFLGFPFDKVSVASKTGTAEIQTVPPKQPFAWFAAYAPTNDPRYVVVVMLEEGGHGGETAAPIARRILEGIFTLPLSDISPADRTD